VKSALSDLAIFQGDSAFPEPLHVGRPNVGDGARLIQRIAQIIDRRWLTNGGPFVEEFESRIARLLGVRHCVAVANGTLGLQIAARASGLDGEVIVPSFTFVASAHALQWQGIKPVFCDVDPTTHNIDPAAVERLISPRTTGILGVHLWGRPAAVDELEELAERHGLRLIFDAAHAFGCSRSGVMLGGSGDAEVLSFHATKFVNAFEGGAIVTNDDQVAEAAARLRNFGFVDYDDVRSVGINGKMSEVSAAMGLTSLESMDAFTAVNQAHYRSYRERLQGLPGARLLEYDPDERSNYQYIVVEVDPEAGLTRDQLLGVLLAEGVIARRYFHPGCHRMEPYRSLDPNAGLRLRNTERLAATVLQLPTGTGVDQEAIATITTVIRLALEHADAVRVRLGAVGRPPYPT
jgi:dTDP-4-amino-4,6-dideoxygalactose transaminase